MVRMKGKRDEKMQHSILYPLSFLYLCLNFYSSVSSNLNFILDACLSHRYIWKHNTKACNHSEHVM